MTPLARRVAVTLAGGALLALGVMLIVLPGPAVLVIPAGLGVLSLEYGWARRLRERIVVWVRERR
ncbi:MAG: PGPGW domain-containing protein [Myxococcota bacterium]|nr:PGPGW domain-containing protein [Myxococcota bacterium]